jgi:hypothetical protein
MHFKSCGITKTTDPADRKSAGDCRRSIDSFIKIRVILGGKTTLLTQRSTRSLRWGVFLGSRAQSGYPLVCPPVGIRKGRTDIYLLSGPLSRIPLPFVTLYKVLVGFSKNKSVVPGPSLSTILETVEKQEKGLLGKYGYADWESYLREARVALRDEERVLGDMIAPGRL